ncbi:uncharacterized protein LOC127848930 [Dreissena polymorpha]|uniref:Uncharacterized protein n=1 Tax=Dreissena polymorpha TaxID=45954 RepID=A0A9D4IA65_DREPO|nr:uncharacterized protein LOC127848675 [Dreissena polymorpha]XP_052237618.1 uncharacterized protein LOC127848930 [Dreissena polymorpha]KAH3754045.1 hypothetical protein DPMN_188703 [Dreissena polymorpha]KAH3754109.1 hypothetical protein DPMN_188770 [Dreissena polymorpha]
MAASGIAEHNEARRKERLMQKIAFKKKTLAKSLQEQYGDNPDMLAMINGTQPDTYERELNQSRKSGSPPGRGGDIRHDAQYVDQMRRNQLRKEQLVEYSAKIPNRFSSVDYVAQW